MSTVVWIIVFGLLMSCIALVGSLTLVLKPQTLDRLLLPLVAFAAGSLIGGALFHMIPAAVREMDNSSQALLYNFASALTFLIGALVACAASARIDVAFLIPFAAGNFLYIGAADLIPEIKKGYHVTTNVIHFVAFSLGLGLLLSLRLVLPGEAS